MPDIEGRVAQNMSVLEKSRHEVEPALLEMKPARHVVAAMGVHALLPREGSGKLHYPDAIAVSPDGATAIVCESFEDRAQAFGPQVPLAPEDQPPPPERVTTAHFGPGVAASGNLMAALEPEAATIVLYRLEPAEPIEITRSGVHGRIHSA